jgi:hypothetical protein
MTISVTFNGVAIQSRQITRERIEGNKVFEVTLDCITDTYSDITSLSTLMGAVTKSRLISGFTSIQTTGTKATLIINGTSYTNCVIDSLEVREVPNTLLGVWSYTISFARETVS